MTIAEILQATPKRKQGEALWLLGSILQRNRAELLLNTAEPLSPIATKLWKKYARARASGKPLQYIVGSAPFWGREFRVGPGVLIPRPETEALVELSLKLFSGEEPVRVLDIGTGSGAIALTLKLERPHWQVVASDVSARALKFARANAAALEAKVDFRRADLFSSPLRRERWGLVVSNPPYLDVRKDSITAEVREWEPRMALEPLARTKIAGMKERAAWCAEHILQGCAENHPRYTALELSARVAALLEKRWRKHEGVERIWRASDLAGKKRFLLVAWKPHAQI